VTLRPGTLVAKKYRVEGTIGEGGMGVVLAARDVQLGRRVALKLLRKDFVAPGAASRLLREARAAAAIDSPHVARVLDVGRTKDGDPYVALECLEGEDLHARVASGPPARVADAARWMLEACEGLAAAHARGIVHRDLKPSNLFLAKRPDGGEILKLLDFGLAKNPDESDGRITATGAILGSPSYMSPEHLSGKALDTRCDVWSLGVTLYELLTRALPFPGGTTPEICAAVLSSQPAPMSVHRADVPAELEALVASCLSKDPAGRPRDVAELAARLEPFAENAEGAAARVARTLASAGREGSVEASASSAPPTHLVSSVEIPLRERGAMTWVLVALAIVAASTIAFVALRDRARPAAPVDAAPPPSLVQAPEPSAPEPPAPIEVPTVVATAPPKKPPRPHPSARVRPRAPDDPMGRF